MNAGDLQSMLVRDQEEWDALCLILDERPNEPLHEKGQPQWSSKDVYAHLARWMNLSTDGIDAWLAGKMPPVEQGTYDEVNARWHQQDASLSFDEARSKAQDAFHRRLNALASVPTERWDSVLDELAVADGWRHFEAHRKGIASA